MKNKVVCALLAAFLAAGSVSVHTVTAYAARMDAYYELAVNYINAGEYEKAENYLDGCLEFISEEEDPRLVADIYLKKGCVYTLTGEYEKALEFLDASLALVPNEMQTYLVKMQVYTEQEDYQQAIDCAQKCIDVCGDTGLYDTIAQIYQGLGDYENAALAYEKFVAGQQEDAGEAAFLTGVYKMQLGLYEKAIDDFENCRDQGCTNDGILYNIGACKLMLEDYEGAEEVLSASVEQENHVSDALYDRGVSRMFLLKYEEAIADFDAYIGDVEEEIETEAVTEGMEAVTEGMEAVTEGMEAVTEGTEAETEGTAPRLDMAVHYRALCKMMSGQYEEAIADYDLCIENEIEVPSSILNRGLSYAQLERFEEATADLTTCIENDYSGAQASYYRGYVEFMTGDYESAIRDYTVSIDKGYERSDSYYYRAQVYKAMGEEDKYYEDLEKSLE